MNSVGLERKLRSYGVKPTPQRMQIGAVLLSEPCHMSADQIIKSLQTAGHRVSKATVYNTLNLFSKQGIIREIAIDPTHLVYDSTTGHHHHFYNLDTGELIDIDSPEVSIDGLPELPAGTTQEGLDLIIRIRNQS